MKFSEKQRTKSFKNPFAAKTVNVKKERHYARDEAKKITVAMGAIRLLYDGSYLHDAHQRHRHHVQKYGHE